jgi:hypothetical protein
MLEHPVHFTLLPVLSNQLQTLPNSGYFGRAFGHGHFDSPHEFFIALVFAFLGLERGQGKSLSLESGRFLNCSSRLAKELVVFHMKLGHVF